MKMLLATDDMERKPHPVIWLKYDNTHCSDVPYRTVRAVPQANHMAVASERGLCPCAEWLNVQY